MSPETINQIVYPILEKLPVSVFEYTYFSDGRKKFTYISPYCEAMFGLSSDTVLDGSFSVLSFIHPLERADFNENYNKWMREAKDFVWEGRVLSATGKVIWVDMRANVCKLEDGDIVWRGVLTDISSRKQAEQNMYEANRRLELAAKGADLGLWDYHFETNTTIIDDRWPEVIGYTKAELQDLFVNYSDFIHLEDRPSYFAAIEKHLQGHSDYYESVYRFQLKNGGWKWIMERGQVVERDLKGNALRTAGTLQDFDRRKIEDQVTLERAGRYRDMIEALPLGVGVHQDGVIVYINSQGAKILGVESREDVIGTSILQFVHPDYRAIVMERVKGVMNGIPSPTVQLKGHRLDGKEITIETTAIPFSYKGRPAAQVIVRDVTEEYEAKQAVRKSDALFAHLFHDSPFGKAMLDDTGNVLLVNAGFRNLFGFAQEELLGKNLNEFIVPPERQHEARNLDLLIPTEEHINIETVRTRKDGKKVFVIMDGVPIVFENKSIGLFASYVDITKQKALEEELRIRNEELDNFVYKVSHDLRAPLSSVLGLVNLAGLTGNDDNLGEYIQTIGQRVKRLDSYIGDVLSHSKNLKLDVNIEQINLPSMLDDALHDLDYLPGADSMIKTINIKGDIFFSDKWRLSEIFRNLISNSIKYRDVTKANPEINIDATITQDWVTIVFSDNGIGINEEHQGKIFEMFYRASLQSDGSGLGLYIVKNAIDKLNGQLNVTSQPRVGTTFELKLPNHTLAAAIPESK